MAAPEGKPAERFGERFGDPSRKGVLGSSPRGVGALREEWVLGVEASGSLRRIKGSGATENVSGLSIRLVRSPNTRARVVRHRKVAGLEQRG